MLTTANGHKRAAIYARVSTILQASEDKVSISEQVADTEQFCNERGYVIVERYIDDKRYKVRGRFVEPSGTRADRPEYTRAIKDGHEGKYDVLVSWKEDRLYRTTRAAVPLGDLLEERGTDNKPRVQVELVREAFDYKMAYLKASIAKIELDNLRERSAMGVRGRLKKGLSLGGCYPLGYNRIDGKLVINEEEARWVRQIFRWYGVDLVPLSEIRRRLIENQVPQKGHSGAIKVPWQKNILYRILKGTHYIGALTVNAVGDKWKIDCPPLVEKWVFDKCQERIATSKSYPARHWDEVYVLAGMVYCGVCGHRMGAKTSYRRVKSGEERISGRFYRCTQACEYPESYKCSKYFSARRVEARVWDVVCNALEHPEVIREQIERKAKRLESECTDVETRIEQLSRRIQGIQEERQWLIEQARKKIITEGEYEVQMGLLAGQREEFEGELQELKQATTHRDDAAKLLAMANQMFEDWRTVRDYLNQPEKDLTEEKRREILTEKQRFLKWLVTRVDLDQEGNLGIEGVLDANVVAAQIKKPIR